MGLDDKIENKADEAGGTAKEWVGEATDNDRLAAEGRAEQTDAKIKQVGEDVKDAAEHVKDEFRDSSDR